MASSFGKIFQVSTFGESHGTALGALVSGVPAGLELSESDIQSELNLRKPSKDSFSTSRDESDQVQILSGVFEGKTIGSPIMAVVYNRDAKSQDYEKLKNLYRPGHADFVFDKKYGFRDHRGGGRSSGRETIGRVIGGAIAKKALQKEKISIVSYLTKIGPIQACKIDPTFASTHPFRFAEESKINEIEKLFEKLKSEGDTIGCVAQTMIRNLPVGLGEPVFDKLDALLAHGILSIGAVKGVSFGDLDPSDYKGSDFNKLDSGVSGGISTGEPLLLNTFVKPPSSIQSPQMMLTTRGEKEEVSLKGRFDTCLGPRIVPVINAMCAIVIYDLFLQNKLSRYD